MFSQDQTGSIAKDIIESLSDEERGSLPKLVEDDILVDVSSKLFSKPT